MIEIDTRMLGIERSYSISSQSFVKVCVTHDL